MPWWFCFVIREIAFWLANQRAREKASREVKKKGGGKLSYYGRQVLHDNSDN